MILGERGRWLGGRYGGGLYSRPLTIDAPGTAPVVVEVIGDSTSNDTIDWPFLWSAYLGTELPDYTVHYHLWNDGDQLFGSAAQRSTGTAGNRSAGLGASDSARFNCTLDMSALTDLDVRVKVAADDWTPSGTPSLIGVDAADPNRGFWLAVNPDGTPKLYWFPDGTFANRIEVSATEATGFANGTAHYLRATLLTDNGAGGYEVRFYTSNTNSSWTQLGDTVTGGSTTTLPSISGNLGLGARGNSNGLDGDYYVAEVRAGIDSPGVVARWDASYYDGEGGSVEGVGQETWTATGSPSATGAFGLMVLNASHTGMGSSDWANATRFPKATPVEPNAVIFNLGHNDGADTTIVDFEGLVDDVVAKYADASIAVVIENAQPPSAANTEAHDTRRGLQRDLARERRYSLWDADAALKSYGPDWTADLMEDWAGGNVHPNSDGQLRIETHIEARTLLA